ncbi:hypothetical protein OMAG_000166 [Candidatus Omnitrophus magneticus]|uniref:Uncharacterized protein n=1 Tax=Candidatus Omnitrophus magneticus TaxID=1609969 RepID=A0A0F0CRR4_9BACT|nr:hypothetical protein OMAG_000166 [Candidatus Omnitrophus magneticus]
MKINIRYEKQSDIFEFQAVEQKLRAHFLLTRAELNDLRTVLEKALLESKTRGIGKNKKEE